MSESDFRDWVRGAWGGWVDGREPRGHRRSGWGSGRGAPDLTLGVQLADALMIREGASGLVLPLPVELKICRMTRGGVQLASESAVNEDQRKWHANAARHGVTTAFLWGLPCGGPLIRWRPFIMQPNNGFCDVSEAVELPWNERAFRLGVEGWLRAQWLISGKSKLSA